jgi:hypothetical protein
MITITQLDFYTPSGMVHTIHWERTSGEAKVYGTQDLPPAEHDTMIPYAELDAETVLLWLENALGDDGLLRIDQKFAEQLLPPSTASGLPWE